MINTLTITRPDDWHIHFRDGQAMHSVLPDTARVFGRAIVMPNLKPPVLTVPDALSYRERLLLAAQGSAFQPLMTLYLTDNTTPEQIREAKASGIIHALKYYPAGATTNSDSGVTDLQKAYSAIAAMEVAGRRRRTVAAASGRRDCQRRHHYISFHRCPSKFRTAA